MCSVDYDESQIKHESENSSSSYIFMDFADRSMNQINKMQELSAKYEDPERSHIYDDDMLEQDTTIDEDLNSFFEKSITSDLSESFPKVTDDLIETYNALASPGRQIRLRNDLQSTVSPAFIPVAIVRGSLETTDTYVSVQNSETIPLDSSDNDFEDMIDPPHIKLHVLPDGLEERKKSSTRTIETEENKKFLKDYDNILEIKKHIVHKLDTKSSYLEEKSLGRKKRKKLTEVKIKRLKTLESKDSHDIQKSNDIKSNLNSLDGLPIEREKSISAQESETTYSNTFSIGERRKSARIKRKVVPFDLRHDS